MHVRRPVVREHLDPVVVCVGHEQPAVLVHGRIAHERGVVLRRICGGDRPLVPVVGRVVHVQALRRGGQYLAVGAGGHVYEGGAEAVRGRSQLQVAADPAGQADRAAVGPVEDPHAAVVRGARAVCHEQPAVGERVDGHRVAQHSLPGGAHVPPRVVQHLHAVVARVCHCYEARRGAVGHGRYPRRPAELPVAGPLRSDGEQQVALGLEHLYAAVLGLGDQYPAVAVRVDGDVHEPRPVLAEPDRLRQGERVVPRRAKHLHAVVSSVGHDDAARGGVDGQAAGPADLPVLRSHAARGPGYAVAVDDVHDRAGRIRDVRAPVGRDGRAARRGQARGPRVDGGGHAARRNVVYDPAVARVRYADAPVCAEGDAGRRAQGRAGGRRDRQVERAVGVEHDDPVVSRVRHDDAPVGGADCNGLGRVERAGARRAGDGRSVAAEPVVYHDAVVARVGHDDEPARPRGRAHGRAHVEHARPRAAEREPVPRGCVEHLHAVVSRVCHDDAPVGWADVDVGGGAQRDVVDAGRGKLERVAQAGGDDAHDRLAPVDDQYVAVVRDGNSRQPRPLVPAPAGELDAGKGVSRHAVDERENPRPRVGHGDLPVAVDGHAGRRLHPAAVGVERAQVPPRLREHLDGAVCGVGHHDVPAAPVDGHAGRARQDAAAKRGDVAPRHVEDYDAPLLAARARCHVVGHRDPAVFVCIRVRRHAGGILKGAAAVRGHLARIPPCAEDHHAGPVVVSGPVGISGVSGPVGISRAPPVGHYDLAVGAGRHPAGRGQALVHQGRPGGVEAGCLRQPVHGPSSGLDARHQHVALRVDGDPVQAALQPLAAPAPAFAADLVALDQGCAEHMHAVVAPVCDQDATGRVGRELGP